MRTQRVNGKKVGPLAGMFLVLAILALFILMTLIGNYISLRTGNDVFPALISLLVAVALGVLIMRTRILSYQYTVANNHIYVERLYGTRTKVLLDIPLNDVLGIGEQKVLCEKYPDARISMRAYLKNDPHPVKALLYRKDSSRHIALLQPNEELAGAMFDKDAREKAAREKWG